jgi:hypothetical protein
VDIHPIERHKRRADRWFAPAALAEGGTAVPARTAAHGPSDKPLNLLDASVMILQVGSALR